MPLNSERPEHSSERLRRAAPASEHSRPKDRQPVGVDHLVGDQHGFLVGCLLQSGRKRLNETYGVIAVRVVGIPCPDVALIVDDFAVRAPT